MKNSTILHVPHASTRIPPELLPDFDREKLPHELAVMTDWFCDELFDCGREQLVFPVSRLVCDPERFRDDRDEEMAAVGMGAVYRSASDGSPLRTVTGPLRQTLLARYYDPHHRAFTAAAEQRLAAFGRCLIVDCHSFHPTPLPYEPDRNTDRPDFCIGTSAFHTPEPMADALEAFLTAQGFRVRRDAPYAGTVVPMRFYRKDPRVRSVMIEVNRSLYLHSPGVKSSRFPAVRALLRSCVEVLETCSGG